MTTSAAGTSPDPVSKLIKLLIEERKNFTSIEIAETLWLAMQMEPAAEFVSEGNGQQVVTFVLSLLIQSGLSQLASRLLQQPSQTPDDRKKGLEPEVSPMPFQDTTPRVNITAPTHQAGVLPPQVLPVYLADPAMLTDSLAIIRALKPLLQKVAAGIGKRLDESATVDNVARTRLWLPILEPEQEPWFDIILVVDRGSSMHIWQRLVKDVVRILRRYGAFRDVQVFDLVVNQAEPSTDRAKADDRVRLLSKPHRPGHRPSELIDQRGRRIVIVLSDCAGTYWWDGTLLPMLQAWGKIMPTVVWQMLPPWMWKRTALGRGTAVAISNDIPGVANQRLKTQVQDRDEPEDANQRLPLPVVTSEVRDLARWSLMVAGDRREVTPGFLLPQRGGSIPRSKGMEAIAQDRAQQTLDEGSETDSDTVFQQALETIAYERVDRFLELSSPQAQRLIMLLAAAPVITPPVVRLIRDAMMYDAQSPLPVAEVFLSGLLLRLPEQEDRELERVAQEANERMQAASEPQDTVQSEADEPEPMPLERQDLVQYDFAPNVRSILLKVLPAVDTIDVLNSVSAAVEKRWNHFSTEDFRAFLMNPAIEAPEGLASLRSFASVTAEILEQLGGEYASFARQLRQGAEEPAPPKPGQEEPSFPDLETLEFTIAQLIDAASTAPFPPLQTQDVEVVTIVFEAKSEELQPFEFESATIERRVEWVIRRQRRQAQRWVEALGNNLQLEMVAIPSGSFLMGSPNGEPDSVVPQHQVRLAAFFMGRYPVTQAQWQFVARLPQVKRELQPDPSYFKGGNCPVERVSWDDAMEFCARLSAHTGRDYRLPTEAEWEYACRAGTTTPFHVGETITPDLANYDGTSMYNDGPKGGNRGKTTPVDHFGLANTFGLCDMHGNVFEWCEDHWHSNYEGAPVDGSAWISENDTANRVVRGGSWYNNPRYSCSAYRNDHAQADVNFFIGFRVVCSAPRTLK